MMKMTSVKSNIGIMALVFLTHILLISMNNRCAKIYYLNQWLVPDVTCFDRKLIKKNGLISILALCFCGLNHPKLIFFTAGPLSNQARYVFLINRAVCVCVG